MTEQNEKSKEEIEEEILESLQKGHTKVKTLIDKFGEYYEITEDTIKALWVIFAIYFEQFVSGDWIWLHIVESIGGCKTTILETFETVDKTFRANNVTPKSLRSSKKDESGKTIGQENLEKLNGKVWLFKDFTSILSQNENDRRAIYGILRDLSDKEISFMSGSNSGSVVVPCRVTIMTGVTETIDRQGYNMQLMGERFAKVRLNLRAKRTEMIHKAMTESGYEDLRKKELQEIFENVYSWFSHEEAWEDQTLIHLNLLESPYALKIEALADLITRLRVYCWKDPRYKDSYVDEPLEEHGTRFVKQLTKMAILLTILFEKTSFDEELWQIVLKFAEDCCLPVRLEILKTFESESFKELTTEWLSDKLDMSRQLTKCRLEELEASHILKAHWAKQYENSSFEVVIGWTVKDEIVKLVKKIYAPVPLVVEITQSDSS